MAPRTLRVDAPNVTYGSDEITASVRHTRVVASVDGDAVTARPVEHTLVVKTHAKVPRLGLMLVGWGGNNGSTFTAGLLANKLGTTWETKEGTRKPDWLGSLTQSSTIHVGSDERGSPVTVPFAAVLPMVRPEDIELGGWDISGADLATAMSRAMVLDVDLQRKLAPAMRDMHPLPSIYDRDFIAANQEERADNVIKGTRKEQLAAVRKDIADFKARTKVDTVIVLWTANTERYCDVTPGVHDSADALLAAIDADNAEVSPSTIFAVASALEGAAYINGSPQNTLVPGVVELAKRQGVFVAGDDFKSGQTKIKSVLVDFLVGAGIRPAAIVSYNHLGNNDGKNLSAPAQFRSKEISKSSVVDDAVAANPQMYPDGKGPDHAVVIKYVPHVGDSKRALDEYSSEIFMGGKNTLVLHNTCEDSLLAVPLILDLVLLAELFSRVSFSLDGRPAEKLHPVLSVLAYMLKAPAVPPGAPVVNALAAQRAALVNILRAAVGLPPEDHMALEHRLPSLLAALRQ